MQVMCPEGYLINLAENKSKTKNAATLSEAAVRNDILEATALLCDAEHNLVVNFGGIKGIIPREEGAIGIKEGEVRDIALISRVGKPVCFTVTKISQDKNGVPIALLSRRNAQEKCKKEFLDNLKVGDIINARVTHFETFGAFCDIGCGIIALLPIDSISVSRISHPRDRFSQGDDIKVAIKSIENGRITLTMKELLGTWQENASLFAAGQTVSGVVRSIEDYGIFVELAPNLAGLAELKSGVFVGQRASVYIKSISPDKMKIKLVIVDSFDMKFLCPSPPKYFYEGNHIDKWEYSPNDANKKIFTQFGA
ncbi:MAG: 30S ribosomal protein S1 [Clostridia bacterium]|nr:30S ribosomal protein S1 [Clostridia bacterium]